MLPTYCNLFKVAVLVLAVSGCGGIEREYVWTRETPAVDRKTPTSFVVRIKIDRAARTIVWVEDVHDADSDLGRYVRTWKDCSVLDDKNWDCPPVIGVDGNELVHVSMRDGKLLQQYWGEDRRFSTRRRLVGFAF